MGQHTVPQQYLRNFEDPKRAGFLWLHEKQGGTPRHAAIKNVVQSKGFYSENTEKLLAQSVELPGNEAIRKLITGQRINLNERFDLAVYVGTMLRRVPYHRRWASGLVPDTLSLVTGNIRDQIRQLAAEGALDPALTERRFREVEAFEEKASRETPKEVTERINNPIPSEAIVGALFVMTWRVVESTGPQFFITSDNPAFYFRGEGYGLGNEPSEVTMPLSTRFALHGSRRGTPRALRFVKARQLFVREFNKRLVSQSDRLTFYHEPAPWLLGLMARAELGLFAIHF